MALAVSHAVPGSAQSVVPPSAAGTLVAFDPPAPLAPSVINRDGDGRATVRVTRIQQPVTIDGLLDEAVYRDVRSFGDFIQQEPNAGAPSTERSEVWVFFDQDHVYVSARLWKSNPDDLIANEMRRDESGIFRNDSIGVVLDTFYDRRSGYYFNTNALGAVRDALLVNENQNANLDFNPVWDVASRRFEQGWTTEMAIPFKSLRYPAGRQQVWGLLVQRIDWKKNEFSYLMPIPPSYGGAGIWKVSSAATLVGIEAPVGGGRLELKPYALSSVSNDRLATPAVSNGVSARAGLDARFQLTKGLNVDFTTNTDFAQVEVDNQQLNLSRFSLFYPEKREFFLEMQNVMNFGPPIGPGGRRSVDDPTPILYFSRNIGLADGSAVPLVAGGRVLGRVGDYTLGGFTMRTGTNDASGAPPTTFSVARVKRNVLRRSSIGLLTTHRAPSAGAQNLVVGAEGNLRLFQNVEANAYYARSDTGAGAGGGSSYLGQFRYAADKYGFEATQSSVSPGFDAQLGFVPRTGFERRFVLARFSPRPPGMPAIRKIGWEASFDNITAAAGILETREARGVFRLNQASGDEVNLTYSHITDRPQNAFSVAGATIARGSYEFDDLRVNYLLGPQRRLVGTVTAARGTYYGGEKSELAYSGRLSMTSRFMVEPTLTLTWLTMPEGEFAARLAAARTTFTVTPRMLVAALVQFNASTRTVATNVRFRWEYRPGSDLFVVYSDNSGGPGARVPGLLSNSFAVKFTRLLQM